MENQLMWAGTVITPSEIIDEGLVVVDGSRIVYAGPRSEWHKPLNGSLVEVKKGWIWPGLIDIHIHGSAGYDTMDSAPEALIAISAQLARFGVTGFLATTMTASLDVLERTVQRVAKIAQDPHTLPGAKVMGIHLEGPWINRAYKGAQNEKSVVNPVLDQVQTLYQASVGFIRLVTLAPELPGADEAIRYLVSEGTKVSAGHSAATFEQIMHAVGLGVDHFTHCFNAMTGLHHREPGVVGAAMYYDHASCELIADGFHVHPVVIKLLYKIKGRDRLVLISDGIRATGMDDGRYELGGQEVLLEDGQAKLADGTLAGSVLTLNQAVANLVNLCGISLQDAVYMASCTPAEVIGVSAYKGKLQAGYDADLTIVNDQYEVLTTVVEGRVVYQRAGE
ncbi:MAG: N-acetylglucosamine-6-phosphate deacetylase [Bacilli bacterium]|nr:N-acetylglucosamine-6-phosphate deacetylase [Bacilli bacterium]